MKSRCCGSDGCLQTKQVSPVIICTNLAFSVHLTNFSLPLLSKPDASMQRNLPERRQQSQEGLVSSIADIHADPETAR